MNPMYLATLLFWALTAVAGYLFFWEDFWGWLQGFNMKYGRVLLPVMMKKKRDQDPTPAAKRLLGIEIGAFALGILLSGHPLFGFWFVGFSLFAIVYFSKIVLIREAETFDDQMVDIAVAFRNALKAGMTLNQAMQLIASDFMAPARDQFEIVLREIQVGASIEEALQHLVERIPNTDLKMMVDSIEILRKTGGNMVETFEGVAETIKNRKKVEGKIKSLVAQGRFQTIMLCAMPFVMAGILYFLNPEYIGPLFSTFLGWIILSAVVALVATGWVIINRLITIEV